MHPHMEVNAADDFDALVRAAHAGKPVTEPVRPEAARPESEAVFAAMFEKTLPLAEAGEPVTEDDLDRLGFTPAEITTHEERLRRHLRLALEHRAYLGIIRARVPCGSAPAGRA